MKKLIVLTSVFCLLLLSIDVYAQKSKKFVSPIMFGVDIGLAIPTGEFADVVNTGFGLNGVFTYFMDRNILFTGSIGYWSFSKEESGIKYTFNTIPLNIGINYRFSNTGLIPYIGAETFLFFNSWKSSYLSYSSSDSETKFGFVPLIGIAYPITPNMEFRGSLKYTIIFTESENTTFLGILAGLHFRL
ncbi:hypothetical protein D9V84_00220 [Bacteroidetes/Chlorobi group bacterium Naka2016]|jgi:opacity protein-like surface antigen|nr:MAG: hypothetical protein D9V84_00220 [Bacteroidetes/Chlorobi group bacterium Naka2016]